MDEILEVGNSDEGLPDDERRSKLAGNVASQVLEVTGLEPVENHRTNQADIFRRRSEIIIDSTVRSGSKHLRKK